MGKSYEKFRRDGEFKRLQMNMVAHFPLNITRIHIQ
jgi:hypothetical protein